MWQKFTILTLKWGLKYPECMFCVLTSDSDSVLLPSAWSLESNASGDTWPAIPSARRERDALWLNIKNVLKIRNETKWHFTVQTNSHPSTSYLWGSSGSDRSLWQTAAESIFPPAPPSVTPNEASCPDFVQRDFDLMPGPSLSPAEYSESKWNSTLLIEYIHHFYNPIQVFGTKYLGRSFENQFLLGDFFFLYIYISSRKCALITHQWLWIHFVLFKYSNNTAHPVQHRKKNLYPACFLPL